MKLRELLEQEDNVTKVIDYIKKFYSKKRITSAIDNVIRKYVPTGWKKEGDFISEFEWYAEFGSGAAEREIIRKTTDEVAGRVNLELSDQEEKKVKNWISDYYNLVD